MGKNTPRPGRPTKAVNPENVRTVLKAVMHDRRVKLRDLAQMLNISTERVGHILHDHLNYWKLHSRWIPRTLTPLEKYQRIHDAEECLQLFKRGKLEFLRRYVTMDETAIYYTTPTANRPKRAKTQQTAEKVVATVFWDALGVIFIDYSDKMRGTRGEYPELLDRLNDEIKENRPDMAKRKVLFHQFNEPQMVTKVKLYRLGYEMLPHPEFSPDLTPSDYHLFAALKRFLQSKKFESRDQAIAEVEAFFDGLDDSFYRQGIEMLEKRWNDCIARRGDYIEE